jgi:hypothetical protein
VALAGGVVIEVDAAELGEDGGAVAQRFEALLDAGEF